MMIRQAVWSVPSQLTHTNCFIVTMVNVLKFEHFSLSAVVITIMAVWGDLGVIWYR